MKYSNKIAFYVCDELGVALYYKRQQAIVAPRFQAKVWCPRLDRHVMIRLIGMGEEGHAKVRDQAFFPVDLFSNPPILDPFPSRTVSDEMFDYWLTIVRNQK